MTRQPYELDMNLHLHISPLCADTLISSLNALRRVNSVPPLFTRQLYSESYIILYRELLLVESCSLTSIKIVADRWEFANEFFKKGEKQLLSDIHQRKNHHIQRHHHQQHSPPFECCTEVIFGWPQPPLFSIAVAIFLKTDFLSTLTEDNRRLRRSNTLLLSEIAHTKKL
ncbi:Heat stress transcription factor B-4 [Platanthera guangdongensis]|uniref:Heat stress transcription factor B-4 n=1 Tax=Platanthera guangdongensis TaxID=2320717 RepID=A0ABR2MEM0_9ASPA